MIHILLGSQTILLIKEAKKNIKKEIPELDIFNFAVYDGRETPIQNIINECSYLSLGYEKKAVIVTYPYYLTNTKEKQAIDGSQDYDKLLEYAKNPNPNCELYFLIEGKLGSNKKDYISALIKNCICENIKDVTELERKNSVALLFKKNNVKITDEAVEEIIKRSGEDFFQVKNNCNKLLNYANVINKDDVANNIFLPLEDNVFLIVDSLFKGNIIKAIKSYRQTLELGYMAPQLLLIFSSQLRIFYLVSLLSNMNLSEDEIAKRLGINPYRVKLAVQIVYRLKSDQLLDMICDLAEIEYNIRVNQENDEDLLELFIVNFHNNYLLRK